MTKFWSEDIRILFNGKNYTQFFPDSDYSVVKNLNSIVRLTIYIGILLSLLKKNPKYIIIPFITMIITYFIYNSHPHKNKLFNQENLHVVKEEHLEKEEECQQPTTNNPVMNYNQITDTPTKNKSCKVFLENDEKSIKTRKVINDKFNEKLYRDVTDLYGRRNSQREFYTVAYDHVPDQSSFAKWCYLTPPTCKERTLNCAPTTGSML